MFERGDPGLELFDVVGGAETGLAPGFCSQDLRQPFLELLNARRQPGRAGLEVGQVGPHGGPANGGADPGDVERLGLQRVELFEQIAVPVEERPVDTGLAGDR